MEEHMSLVSPLSLLSFVKSCASEHWRCVSRFVKEVAILVRDVSILDRMSMRLVPFVWTVYEMNRPAFSKCLLCCRAARKEGHQSRNFLLHSPVLQVPQLLEEFVDFYTPLSLNW